MEAAGYCAKLALGIEQAKQVIGEYMAAPMTATLGEKEIIVAGTDW
jgi:hypothetical protein